MSASEPRHGVDISDGRDGVLTIDLRQIVDTLGVEGISQLHWRLFHLWAVGVLPGPRTVLDYEELAESSECGFPLEWNEVQLLADNTDQIIDAVFAAFETVPNERLKSDALLKHALVVVEANDSSSWRVISTNPKHVEAIRAAFKDVAPLSRE